MLYMMRFHNYLHCLCACACIYEVLNCIYMNEKSRAFMVADLDDEWEEMIQQAVDRSLADGTAPIP